MDIFFMIKILVKFDLITQKHVKRIQNEKTSTLLSNVRRVPWKKKLILFLVSLKKKYFIPL